MIPYYEQNQRRVRLSSVKKKFWFRGHLHVECELIWVRTGQMHIICDNQEYRIGAGEMFMIFPNQVHAYLETVDDVDGYFVLFHPEDAPLLKKHLIHTYPKHPWLKGDEISPELAYSLDWLEREYVAQNEKMVKALISTIMVKAYESVEPVENAGGREADVIRQAMEYLNEHYAENISLEGLARKMGVSHYHLSHLFSGYLKMGFRAYLNALRMEEAKRLLKTTDEPITQIAYSCGYNSQTTFNRVFRERFDKTPREMRDEKK
ncbi:MAG: helix-turn-helix domain-containing protein [Firmicutes bacterium]|nr:helix-turn-helix domain-containing protein [Bacillota bacterium]